MPLVDDRTIARDLRAAIGDLVRQAGPKGVTFTAVEAPKGSAVSHLWTPACAFATGYLREHLLRQTVGLDAHNSLIDATVRGMIEHEPANSFDRFERIDCPAGFKLITPNR